MLSVQQLRDAIRCLQDTLKCALEFTSNLESDVNSISDLCSLPLARPPACEAHPVVNLDQMAEEAKRRLASYIYARYCNASLALQQDMERLAEELYWDFEDAEEIRLKSPGAEQIYIPVDRKFLGMCRIGVRNEIIRR